jgi:hypothetical protein
MLCFGSFFYWPDPLNIPQRFSGRGNPHKGSAARLPRKQ